MQLIAVVLLAAMVLILQVNSTDNLSICISLHQSVAAQSHSAVGCPDWAVSKTVSLFPRMLMIMNNAVFIITFQPESDATQQGSGVGRPGCVKVSSRERETL